MNESAVGLFIDSLAGQPLELVDDGQREDVQRRAPLLSVNDGELAIGLALDDQSPM